MKIFLVVFFGILNCLDGIRQHNELEKYMGKLCARCQFLHLPEDKLMVTEKGSDRIKKSVRYMKRGSFYVGVIENYFFKMEENVVPNYDRFLFAFDEDSKTSILFVNNLNSTKNVNENIDMRDLFMPNQIVVGFVFDENYNFKKSFRVLPADFNELVTVEEWKASGNGYSARTIKSNYRIYYEDFCKSTLFDIADFSFSILAQISDSEVKEPWHAEFSPYRNLFINAWKVKEK